MLTRRQIAPLLIGAALLACDADSTGPGAVDLAVVASSFDALGRSRMSSGDGSGAVAARIAAFALRTGVRPARVRIAVDGVTEDYWALQVDYAIAGSISDNSVSGPTFARSMVAWRGGPVERVISITIASDTGTFSWARSSPVELPPDRIYYEPGFGIMFERGGRAHFSVDGGARSIRETVGAECEMPRRPPIMQWLAPGSEPLSCRTAAFLTRFNMRVHEGPPEGAAAARVRVVQMAGHNVPGILLVLPLMYRPCPACN